MKSGVDHWRLEASMGSGRWVYAATVAVGAGTMVRIVVTATDRPGGVGGFPHLPFSHSPISPAGGGQGKAWIEELFGADEKSL